jgi:hypothetical protein
MAENQDNTGPLWWTLTQVLVWILQQVEMSPQEAEQFCNALSPKIIEGALNALARALFSVLYGAVGGLPVVAARILYGRCYKDLAAVFPLPPSPTPGVVDTLRNDLRQFIVRSDVEYSSIWAKRAWPGRAPAAQTVPTSTPPTESAVADEAKPLPGSKVGSGEPPSKPDASMPANVGYVDPGIASAIDHFAKRARARSARTADEIIAEIAKSLSDSLARSGEAKASGSDPAARAEETASQAQQPPPQQWDPRADWSVETVFRELGIKGPQQKVIVEALPKIYGDDIAGALDRLVAKTPWPTSELRNAIWKLLEKEAGKQLRGGEIPSWDACKDFLIAWHKWRARRP